MKSIFDPLDGDVWKVEIKNIVHFIPNELMQ